MKFTYYYIQDYLNKQEIKKINSIFKKKSIEFKKQVAAGAASQRMLQDAVSFGTGLLTKPVTIGKGANKQTTSLAGLGISSVLGAFGIGGGTGGGTGATIGAGAGGVTGVDPISDDAAFGDPFDDLFEEVSFIPDSPFDDFDDFDESFLEDDTFII